MRYFIVTVGRQAFSKRSLAAPQSGQTQLAGRSSNLTPGLISCVLSPIAGSYTYPHTVQIHFSMTVPPCVCLLYTSDAADDLLCVDLGGRRIIKKKKGKDVN